ncbi:hypothetical protein [Hyperthermus butylicus]|uniref:hypothetical protein n=1 Tax=Hyperthermus butylicus TaxID=54248 RepID=UPI00129B7E7D|nr:hypothetical protein [Hyperthermus butylicus]
MPSYWFHPSYTMEVQEETATPTLRTASCRLARPVALLMPAYTTMESVVLNTTV